MRGLLLQLFGLVLYFLALSIFLTGCWQQEETEAAGGLLQSFRGASGEETPPQPPALHLCPAGQAGKCPAGGECYSCLLYPSLIVTTHIQLTLPHQSVSDPAFTPCLQRDQPGAIQEPVWGDSQPFLSSASFDAVAETIMAWLTDSPYNSEM